METDKPKICSRIHPHCDFGIDARANGKKDPSLQGTGLRKRAEFQIGRREDRVWSVRALS